MRKTITHLALVALALAGLIGLAPVAQAAAARADVPTCLIANGGDGGRYTKVMTCVQLVANRYGDMGSGRYSDSPASGQHTLTVTVEYQKYSYGHTQWVRLAQTTARGRGDLTANTSSVRAPRATTRACVSVTTGHTPGGELCTR
jgi:hypothetical protein